MSVALQIRGVPEEVRDALADQAAKKGQSLQALLLALVTQQAKAASNADMFERTAKYRVDLSDWDLVALVREGRDGGFEIDRENL